MFYARIYDAKYLAQYDEIQTEKSKRYNGPILIKSNEITRRIIDDCSGRIEEVKKANLNKDVLRYLSETREKCQSLEIFVSRILGERIEK